MPQSLPPSLGSALLNLSLDQSYLPVAQVCQLRWLRHMLLESRINRKSIRWSQQQPVTSITRVCIFAALDLSAQAFKRSEVLGCGVHGGCPPCVRLHAAPHIQRANERALSERCLRTALAVSLQWFT